MAENRSIGGMYSEEERERRQDQLIPTVAPVIFDGIDIGYAVDDCGNVYRSDGGLNTIPLTVKDISKRISEWGIKYTNC